MSAPQPALKKPVQSSGDKRPQWMKDLGITRWSVVPDPVIRRLMSDRFPLKVRIMALCTRHSFGFFRDYCVRLATKAERDERPAELIEGRFLKFSPADMARALEVDRGNFKRAVRELEADGLIRRHEHTGGIGHSKGNVTIFVYADPIEPRPFVEEGEEEAKVEKDLYSSDPEYRAAVEQIESHYRERLRELKAAYQGAIDYLRREFNGVNSDPQNQPGNGVSSDSQPDDFDPHLGVNSDPSLIGSYNHSYYRTSERTDAGAPNRDPEAPAASAEEPSGLAELSAYLRERWMPLVGRPPFDVEGILGRLTPAAVSDFIHVSESTIERTPPRTYGLAVTLATDCSIAARMRMSEEQQQLEAENRRQIEESRRIDLQQRYEFWREEQIRSYIQEHFSPQQLEIVLARHLTSAIAERPAIQGIPPELQRHEAEQRLHRAIAQDLELPSAEQWIAGHST